MKPYSSPLLSLILLLPPLLLFPLCLHLGACAQSGPMNKAEPALKGSAVKLAGTWAIEVPNHPGRRIVLNITEAGTYSAHADELDNPAIESGTITARSGTFALKALSGEYAGRSDEGTYRLIAMNQLLLHGQLGKGTWVRLDESGKPLIQPIPAQQANHDRGAPASDEVRAKSIAGRFIPEIQGTAVPAGRNESQTYRGTAIPFGRNEFAGRRTSGFILPASPLQTASSAQTASPLQTASSAQTAGALLATVPRQSSEQSPRMVLGAVDNMSKESPAKPNPNRPIKDKWALVIGISEFQNSALNLKCPATDASDFARFLVQHCRFANDHVKLLINAQATRAQILNELGDKWLPRVVRPDDLVLVYISTHGSPSDADLGGVNYLLAWDTDPESLYATGVPMQDLTAIIKARLRSDRVVMVLDACYSGNVSPQSKGLHRAANVNIEEIAQGTGQMVISSSQSNQLSWESKTGNNSVFTKHLMSALRLRGDKTKLGEAFRTLKDRVEEEVQRDRGKLQTPVIKSLWEGSDLMISVPPAEPRPGL